MEIIRTKEELEEEIAQLKLQLNRYQSVLDNSNEGKTPVSSNINFI